MIDCRVASWVAWTPLGARRFLVSLARLRPKCGMIRDNSRYAAFCPLLPGKARKWIASCNLILVRPMRRELLVGLVVVCVSTSMAQPSNYFYRVSLSGAALKQEPVLYAKRPDYPVEARRQHLTGSGLFALHIRRDGGVERVEMLSPASCHGDRRTLSTRQGSRCSCTR
jgi:hypothetical protein